MEILSSKVVDIMGNNSLCWIGLILLGIGFISLLFGLVMFDEVWWAIIVGIFIMVLGVLLVKESVYVQDTYTEYKVSIDESANFHAVMDKYEILDQEGEIYTVRKKVNNK